MEIYLLDKSKFLVYTSRLLPINNPGPRQHLTKLQFCLHSSFLPGTDPFLVFHSEDLFRLVLMITVDNGRHRIKKDEGNDKLRSEFTLEW